ncbi:MAG: PKD domain-containing protein [Bacteroidia bacterium]
MQKKFILLLLLLACAFQFATAQAKKILFLGNSYTGVNNLPKILYDLAVAKGDTLMYDSNTPGGYTFNGHSTNATSLAKINAQIWDFVVLQEQSQLPSFPPSQVATEVYPYANVLDSLIHAHSPCAQTVFYMTWGRKYGDQQNCASYPVVCTFEGMQMRLRHSYVQMADDNQALVAPAGMAWRASRLADSTINLWVGDNSHPSIHGSYLTACVFYATLFKKTPVGLDSLVGITTNQAKFLQNIAAATVFDSLSVWNINEFMPVADFNTTIQHDTVNFLPNVQFATHYQWNFGDTSAIDTSANPTHIYGDSGTYTVQLIVSNNCGISDTSEQVITVQSAAINTSIISPILAASILVAPNPSQTSWIVQNQSKALIQNMTLYNVWGVPLLQTVNPILDASFYPNGIYILRIVTSQGIVTKKLIKG